MNLRWQDFFILSAIILLAAFFRLYRLDALPPGLHFDEAFNATMARNVLLGVERPIYFRQDMTEEPMAIYLTAFAFAILGQNAWTLRLVSALTGIATVAAIYFLARAIFRSRLVAALSAFILAILYWHINFSRLGMEPIFTPLMLTLAGVFLWRGLVATTPARKFFAMICAGIFFAGALYTYKAGLFAPILVAAFLILEIIFDRAFWARHWRGLVVFSIVAILVYAPLGLYFAAHPNEFFERPSSVAASTGATIADNSLRVAGMFFVGGDTNPRSNLPGRPALDPFLAIGFIVGVIVCLSRFRASSPSRLLLLWLTIMSAPSIVTDFAPHFGRNLAVTPALALITAFGFAWLYERFITNYQLPITIALVAGLAFSTVSTARDYFVTWGTRTGLFDSFDVGLNSLAQKLRARPTDELIYITPAEPEHYTIRFAMQDRSFESFDGRRVLVIAPTAATYGITRDDTRTRAQIEKIFPASRVIETLYDFTAQPYAIMVRIEGTPQIAPEKIVNAHLGDAIELIGFDRARDSNTITLTVYWRSRAITRDDYTVFAQLIGAGQAPVIAQDDAQPGRGSFPTSRWRVGEIIVDEYRIAIPATVPRGEFEIQIGMYHLHTGARLPILDANGAPTERDSVSIERITFP